MAIVRVAWVAAFQNVPPTTPPLDSWKVAVGIPGSAPAADVVVTDLAIREADLDVANGVGYVASVGLVSADGTATGPGASSSPFDVAALPVPISVSVTFP